MCGGVRVRESVCDRGDGGRRAGGERQTDKEKIICGEGYRKRQIELVAECVCVCV